MCYTLGTYTMILLHDETKVSKRERERKQQSKINLQSEQLYTFFLSLRKKNRSFFYFFPLFFGVINNIKNTPSGPRPWELKKKKSGVKHGIYYTLI